MDYHDKDKVEDEGQVIISVQPSNGIIWNKLKVISHFQSS